MASNIARIPKPASNIPGRDSAGFTPDAHVTNEMQKRAVQRIGSFMAQTI